MSENIPVWWNFFSAWLRPHGLLTGGRFVEIDKRPGEAGVRTMLRNHGQSPDQQWSGGPFEELAAHLAGQIKISTCVAVFAVASPDADEWRLLAEKWIGDTGFVACAGPGVTEVGLREVFRHVHGFKLGRVSAWHLVPLEARDPALVWDESLGKSAEAQTVYLAGLVPPDLLKQEMLIRCPEAGETRPDFSSQREHWSRLVALRESQILKLTKS